MNDYPVTRGARPGDPHLRLRLAALIAVIVGVVLVAAAAFLLSYAGIHKIALQAGVSPTLARLYPLMFDAMLVVTCAAVLALRNAGWGTKFYVWMCLLVVLAAVAAGDALHATGVQLTGQAARAAIAVIPWVLLLMGFGIWLVMLRQWRRARAAAAVSAAGTANTAESSQAGWEHPAVETPAAAAGAVTWAAGRGAAPDRPGGPAGGTGTLPQRDAGQAPDRTTATETAPAGTPPPSPAPSAAPDPTPAQERQQRTGEPDQDRPAAGTAGAGVAGAVGAAAAVSGAGAAGTRQNGATTGAARTSQERGRKDSAGDRGRRTRLGGLLKLPDSKRDEEEEEGAVRVLPPEPKAAGTGEDSHADGTGTQAGDDAKAAQAGDDAKAAQAGDDAKAADAANAGDGSKTGDTAHGGDGADTGPLPAPLPAAALAPHFDRLRSSPTPPGETETSRG